MFYTAGKIERCWRGRNSGDGPAASAPRLSFVKRGATMNGYIRTSSATVVVLFSLLAVLPLPVHAQAACFSAFNGTVFYVFNISGATVDHRVVSPLSGRVSGALSACAG